MCSLMSDGKRKQIDLNSSGKLEREIRKNTKITITVREENTDRINMSKMETMLEELLKKVDQIAKDNRKLRLKHKGI